MKAVRSYPSDLLDETVSWCRANAALEPLSVLCVGLALVRGLNEHQIRLARLESADTDVAVSFPLARRECDIPLADTRKITLDAPAWLALAARTLIAEKGISVGQRVIPTRSALNFPVSVTSVHRAVSSATIAATGRRLTCAGLNRTRIALAREEGFSLVAFGTGYAPSWAARRAAAPIRHHLPPIVQ